MNTWHSAVVEAERTTFGAVALLPSVGPGVTSESAGLQAQCLTLNHLVGPRPYFLLLLFCFV